MPQRRGRGEGSIRLRRRADESVYYEARATIHGKQVSFYDDTKTGAQAKARAAKVDAERGVARPLGALTVGQFLDGWLEHTAKGSVRSRTYSSYEMHCRVHIVPAIGHLKLVDLSPAHIRKMLADLMHRDGLSDTSVRHIRSTLSGALKIAMLDHDLPRNVASMVKVPKSDKPAFQAEVVTPEEARGIIAAFRGSRLEPIVMFAAATGVRQGELLALRWEDLDLDSRLMTIRYAIDVKDGQRVPARPKSAKAQRTLGLPGLAMRALEMRRLQMEEDQIVAGDAWRDVGLVFAGPTGGIRDGRAVTRNFQGLLARRGLRPIRWHALRRVFAAVLQDQGVSLVQIRDSLGHSELRVTEGYAYAMPDSLLESISAVDAVLGIGIATPDDEDPKVN